MCHDSPSRRDKLLLTPLSRYGPTLTFWCAEFGTSVDVMWRRSGLNDGRTINSIRWVAIVVEQGQVVQTKDGLGLFISRSNSPTSSSKLLRQVFAISVSLLLIKFSFPFFFFNRRRPHESPRGSCSSFVSRVVFLVRATVVFDHSDPPSAQLILNHFIALLYARAPFLLVFGALFSFPLFRFLFISSFYLLFSFCCATVLDAFLSLNLRALISD